MRCFVIQPFDSGQFDKRFDDILVPAIEKAGMEPYRVDRDPHVVIPIDAIEAGIRDAAACVADISTDNPNVWFELGYAIACQTPLILMCDNGRKTPFPFDVQHRHIIKYKTESPRDFNDLATEIQERLRAALKKARSIQTLSSPALAETEGLEPYEIAALVIIAESDLDNNASSSYTIKSDMSRAGYNDLAAVLAVKALLKKEYVCAADGSTYSGDSFPAFGLTDLGTRWLMLNRSRLTLRQSNENEPSKAGDLPF